MNWLASSMNLVSKYLIAHQLAGYCKYRKVSKNRNILNSYFYSCTFIFYCYKVGSPGYPFLAVWMIYSKIVLIFN